MIGSLPELGLGMLVVGHTGARLSRERPGPGRAVIASWNASVFEASSDAETPLLDLRPSKTRILAGQSARGVGGRGVVPVALPA